MKRKEIKRLAKKIIKLEKECQSKNDFSNAAAEMQQIAQGLSIEDLIDLDIYIQETKLLTK